MIPLPPIPPPFDAVDDVVRTGLEAFRDCWFDRLLAFTFMVFVGLVCEAPEIWHETVHALRALFHSCKPGKPLSPLLKLAGTVGWVLIVVGVGGEFVAEGMSSRADGFVQKFDEILLSHEQVRAAILERDAAQLRKDAEDERMARVRLQERVAWRTISPDDIARIGSRLSFHRDIRIAVATVAGNEEAVSFAEDVGSIFTAARWTFLGVVPMGNLGVQRFGMHISTTRDGPTRAAAQDLKKALDKLGFRPAYDESDQVFNGGGAGIYVYVELRPRVVPINKNAPSKP